MADFDAMTDIPQKLRDSLRAQAEITPPRIVLAQPASDGTIKWVLELADGQHIETVYIPEEGAVRSVCRRRSAARSIARSVPQRSRVQPQPQCRRDHRSGLAGGTRIGRPPTNVVMMGHMGEPLANFDNVVPAMELMQEDLALHDLQGTGHAEHLRRGAGTAATA